MKYVAFKAECGSCKYYIDKKCKRNPKSEVKKESEFCGEFGTNISYGTPVYPWDKKYNEL